MINFKIRPRVGVSGENVSPPATGHQKGQKLASVSVGKLFFPIFFLNEVTGGTPRHTCL